MKIFSDIKNLFKSDTPSVSAPSTAEIGWQDSSLYLSKDFPKYNPDSLMSRKGRQVYKAMMLDDQIKAVLQFKQYAVVSRKFYFDIGIDENGEEKPEHQEMAEFFDRVIQQIQGSFTDNLIAILSALQNGFSITEKVYQSITWQNQEMWGVKALKLRPFASFDGGFKVDEYGNIYELMQLQAGNEKAIPLNKVIHFVHQPDIDVHYGESDLRACYRSYWSKDLLIKFQNIHLERHASGFLWASVKGALTPAQKADLQNLINNMSAKMGASLPDNIDLKSFQPMRTDAYERAIAQHDKAIAKSILVPNLLGLSEQGNTGSYSQSQTQLEAFFWILDSISNRLAETLNEQLFRQLAIWNFGTEDFPWFTFEPISDAKKIELAKGWAELVRNRAVTKTDSDEAWIRRLIGAPEKLIEEEEEIEEESVNDDWIEDQDEEKAELIRREFSERPWLKRVNFRRLERNFDNNDDKFKIELSKTLAPVAVSLKKQITKLADQRSFGFVKPKEIDEIKIPAKLMTQVRKTMRAGLQNAYSDSYDLAKKELPKKKVKILKQYMDQTQAEKFFSSRAMRSAGVIEHDTMYYLKITLEDAIKYDWTLQQTIDKIEEYTKLTEILPATNASGRAINVPHRLENIVRTNTADAINQARKSLFDSPELKGFVLAFEYSAILDDRVTGVCEALHGTIRKDFGNLIPPNHFMCRSILIPVTVVDEWSGKESKSPTVTPQSGFG